MSKTQAKKKKKILLKHSTPLIYYEARYTIQASGLDLRKLMTTLQSGYRHADHFDAWVKEYHCILCAVHSV